MSKNEYKFEILIIDPSGDSEIKSPKNLQYGLLSTEKLWDNPKQFNESGSYAIVDEDISLQINSLDTSSVLYDLYESAFLLVIRSSNFERLENMRFPLVLHLLNRLKFNHIRILSDDVSMEISNRIYPLLNELENMLRRYIAKFFTQKVGLDWWQQAVPDKVIEKTKMRQDNESKFSKIVVTDMTLIDFNDLGEIIYKHKLGFNKPENLIEKILSISTEGELEKLKTDLDSNYNRFFKQHFQNFGFDKKWKQLFLIRNKVAHNNLFVREDLENSEKLYTELKEIILKAESNIDDFKFSVVEQEAMIKASGLKFQEAQVISNSPNQEGQGLKVVGKIELDTGDWNRSGVISEEQLIEELKRAQISINKGQRTFIGLKSFVINILEPKGYSVGPTYAQINVLKEKGIVEIYDLEDIKYSPHPVKAIKVLIS